jgi:glycosyltransferase involved in cell wall biosynthesis
MKTVSIVTVVRNGAGTIEETLQSILDQQGPGVEYHLVDGGSTDGTMEIVRRYESRLTSCTSEPDGGISDAFNRGIARCTGDYIGLISSDDLLWPGAIAAVRDAADRHPDADVIYGNACYLAANGRRVISRPEVGLEKIDRRSPLRHAAVFVSREAYARYGGFDPGYELAMDYELFARFHAAGARFVYVDHVLAGIREGGVSARRYRETIAETRRISMRYGYPALPAYLQSWRHLGWTLLKRGLEGAGLTSVIDRYRASSRRFGPSDETHP